MPRFLTALIILLATLASTTGSTLAAQDGCDALPDYFGEIERRVAEPMIALFDDDEWHAALEIASRKAEASDMSILALSEADMEPFLQLITIPGDALATFDEDEIPEVARDLHSSALEQWVMIPAMLRTVATDGMFAAMIFVESVEEAELANWAAQQDIEAACPDVIATLRQQAENAETTDAAFDIDDPASLTKLDPSAFEGFGYTILFLTDEEDIDDATPESLSRLIHTLR